MGIMDNLKGLFGGGDDAPEVKPKKKKKAPAPIGTRRELETDDSDVELTMGRPDLKELPTGSPYLDYVDKTTKSEIDRDEAIKAAKKARKEGRSRAAWTKLFNEGADALGRMAAGKAGATEYNPRQLDLSSYIDSVNEDYQDASEEAQTAHKDRAHQAMIDRVLQEQEIDKIKDENRKTKEDYKQKVKEARAKQKERNKEIKKLRGLDKEIDKRAEEEIKGIDRTFRKSQSMLDKYGKKNDELEGLMSDPVFFDSLPGDKDDKARLREALENADGIRADRDAFKKWQNSLKTKILSGIADRAAVARKDAGLLIEDKPQESLTEQPKSDIIEIVPINPEGNKAAPRKIKRENLEAEQARYEGIGWKLEVIE